MDDDPVEEGEGEQEERRGPAAVRTDGRCVTFSRVLDPRRSESAAAASIRSSDPAFVRTCDCTSKALSSVW